MLTRHLKRLLKLRLNPMVAVPHVLSPHRLYANWLLNALLLLFVCGLAWQLWSSPASAQNALDFYQSQSTRLSQEVSRLQSQILALKIQDQSRRTMLITEQASQQAMAAQLSDLQKENSELKKNLQLYAQILPEKRP